MAIATHVPYQTGTCNVHIHDYAHSDTTSVWVLLNVTDGGDNQLNYTTAKIKWNENVTIPKEYLGGLRYPLEVMFPALYDFDVTVKKKKKKRDEGPPGLYGSWEYYVNITAGSTTWTSDDTDESHLPYCSVGDWGNGGFIPKNDPDRQMDCHWDC
ncbi:hypothetical protein VTN77DRAFT_1626 [Rasamsonia byssochlamydoides]|uniref:uncharacterized protein n=1 Tax=Rasamsonia byssochlamydoides TaxID=89139 RepID=UPI00374270D9